MAQKRNYATKQEGSTKVDPFWNYRDIKDMMDWFINHEQYDNYLTFMFGLLMGRRIGDTLSIKWENLYHKNGRIRDEIFFKEQKTSKSSEVFISEMMKNVISFYIDKTGKNPMNSYNDYVFLYNPREKWIKREHDYFYELDEDDSEKIVDNWAKYLNKDISEKRKESIIEDYIKQCNSKNKRKTIYKRLQDYLYYYVEYMDIEKSQQDVYRKQLVLAAKEIGLKYPVSTHSTRKTFGRITKIIHPNDIYCMQTLQDMFEHATEEQTRDYIGISKEKKREYYQDIGDVIQRVATGDEEILINNSPIVSLRHEDIRKIIMFCIQENGSEIELFNHAMDMIDELKIKNI